MSVPFILPFDNNPVETMFGSFSYTVPAGKFACLVNTNPIAQINGEKICRISQQNELITVSGYRNYFINASHGSHDYWDITGSRVSGTMAAYLYYANLAATGASPYTLVIDANIAIFTGVTSFNLSSTSTDITAAGTSGQYNASVASSQYCLNFQASGTGSFNVIFNKYKVTGTPIWVKEGDVIIATGALAIYNKIS